jgi:hypothetical protein
VKKQLNDYMNRKSVFGIMSIIAGLMIASIPSANAVLYDFNTDKPLEISDKGEYFIVMYIVQLEAQANSSSFNVETLNEYVNDVFIP